VRLLERHVVRIVLPYSQTGCVVAEGLGVHAADCPEGGASPQRHLEIEAGFDTELVPAIRIGAQEIL
jgi:hypothetical protein